MCMYFFPYILFAYIYQEIYRILPPLLFPLSAGKTASVFHRKMQKADFYKITVVKEPQFFY
jgi:hypothetical protein